MSNETRKELRDRLEKFWIVKMSVHDLDFLDALVFLEKKRTRNVCFRDMVHLINRSIVDTPEDANGKEALRILGAAVVHQGREGFGDV